MQSRVQKVEVPVVANVAAAAVEKRKEEKGKEKVVVKEV